MGRPPVQHLKHVHVLALSPEVEEFLIKALDRLTIHRTIQAGGEALKGALSHPAGYLSVLAGVLIAAHTLPIIGPAIVEAEKKAADAAGKAVETYVKDTWTTIARGAEEQREEQREAQGEWVNSIWEAIKWVFQF